jgi:hypothetical protein
MNSMHFWVRISARDKRGRLQAPVAQLLVYARDARSACHAECVIDARDRVRQALDCGEYVIDTTVATVGGEGMVSHAS